ncbi:MAG: nicotinate-nucleotide--dimethylbenzimidazole phosphoribosyltransferase [Acidimicrobiales bacterium]
MTSLSEALAGIRPVDEAAVLEADERQGQLTKPPGALGALERLGAKLAGIAAVCPPPVPRRAVVAVFAGDHGVLAEGVSPWPVEVTAQMVANFLAGGAGVNVIAAEVGMAVVAVDVGVATPIPVVLAGEPGQSSATSGVNRLVRARVRPGTGNLVIEPAMSLAEARQAVQVGLSIAGRLVDQGADLLVTGDMGIGNTTPSAALVAAITKWPARAVTGRGTGISDEVLEKKIAVVEAGLERVAAAYSLAPTDLDSLAGDVLLSELGGLEIGAIAGFVIGGALRQVPVVVDGVISLAGALVAASLAPDVVGYLVAGHRSVEPGATAAMQHLDLEPLLDLGLRLGEGTGGCLAVPLIRAAARILNEMATFGDAGVSGSTEQ